MSPTIDGQCGASRDETGAYYLTDAEWRRWQKQRQRENERSAREREKRREHERLQRAHEAIIEASILRAHHHPRSAPGSPEEELGFQLRLAYYVLDQREREIRAVARKVACHAQRARPDRRSGDHRTPEPGDRRPPRDRRSHRWTRQRRLGGSVPQRRHGDRLRTNPRHGYPADTGDRGRVVHGRRAEAQRPAGAGGRARLSASSPSTSKRCQRTTSAGTGA